MGAVGSPTSTSMTAIKVKIKVMIKVNSRHPEMMAITAVTGIIHHSHCST
jgi:hypothetical protein